MNSIYESPLTQTPRHSASYARNSYRYGHFRHLSSASKIVPSIRLGMRNEPIMISGRSGLGESIYSGAPGFNSYVGLNQSASKSLALSSLPRQLNSRFTKSNHHQSRIVPATSRIATSHLPKPISTGLGRQSYLASNILGDYDKFNPEYFEDLRPVYEIQPIYHKDVGTQRRVSREAPPTYLNTPQPILEVPREHFYQQPQIVEEIPRISYFEEVEYRQEPLIETNLREPVDQTNYFHQRPTQSEWNKSLRSPVATRRTLGRLETVKPVLVESNIPNPDEGMIL